MICLWIMAKADEGVSLCRNSRLGVCCYVLWL